MKRLIRLRDAPVYLDRDENCFNSEMRSPLIEKLDDQSIAFGKLNLNAWINHYSLRGNP
ncbi:MAG: hypothetical protein K0S27_1355 [Gammaproteobacteria bacterium]|jgi:hypothetical protein|nr:hypothetical protein [Gammaproteobacteria bacterium]